MRAIRVGTANSIDKIIDRPITIPLSLLPKKASINDFLRTDKGMHVALQVARLTPDIPCAICQSRRHASRAIRKNRGVHVGPSGKVVVIACGQGIAGEALAPLANSDIHRPYRPTIRCRNESTVLLPNIEESIVICRHTRSASLSNRLHLPLHCSCRASRRCARTGRDLRRSWSVMWPLCDPAALFKSCQRGTNRCVNRFS
mgnify:CR=1 FL=1